MSDSHVYGFLIIGSGFGGSVSALRLVEKCALAERAMIFIPDKK